MIDKLQSWRYDCLCFVSAQIFIIYAPRSLFTPSITFHMYCMDVHSHSGASLIVDSSLLLNVTYLAGISRYLAQRAFSLFGSGCKEFLSDKVILIISFHILIFRSTQLCFRQVPVVVHFGH